MHTLLDKAYVIGLNSDSNGRSGFEMTANLLLPPFKVNPSGSCVSLDFIHTSGMLIMEFVAYTAYTDNNNGTAGIPHLAFIHSVSLGHIWNQLFINVPVAVMGSKVQLIITIKDKAARASTIAAAFDNIQLLGMTCSLARGE